MRLSPEVLSVLAQVILLRQQRERERSDIRLSSERFITSVTDLFIFFYHSAISNIWIRFMNTLKVLTLQSDVNTASIDGKLRQGTRHTYYLHNVADLTVEHGQLLLMFFHGLPLKQRKQILLVLGQTIVSIALEFSNLYAYM